MMFIVQPKEVLFKLIDSKIKNFFLPVIGACTGVGKV